MAPRRPSAAAGPEVPQCAEAPSAVHAALAEVVSTVLGAASTAVEAASMGVEAAGASMGAEVPLVAEAEVATLPAEVVAEVAITSRDVQLNSESRRANRRFSFYTLDAFSRRKMKAIASSETASARISRPRPALSIAA